MIPVSNSTQRVDLFQNPMLNPNNRLNSSQNMVVSQEVPVVSQEMVTDVVSNPMQQAQTNPNFASAMARTAAYMPDTMYMDTNNAPPSEDSDEWLAWNEQYNNFNTQAADVTQQRIGMYNQMKDQGSSDYEIFQAIVNFNNGLPLDYRNMAGLNNVETMV